MSTVSDRLVQLSPEQRELVARRLARQSSRAGRIPRRSGEGLAALSYSQERIWFLEQLFPDLPPHNIAGVGRFVGSFNPTLYCRALSAVAARHESLRTAVIEIDGQPRQDIRPPVEVEPALFDLSAVEAGQRDAEAARLLAAEARRRFDLSRGALLRVAVIRLAEQDHWVLVCLHHVASDGWSSSILVRETFATYERLTRGLPPELPELPVQYADFSAWQRSRVSGREFVRHLEYWKNHLRGLPGKLELPADAPRPDSPRHRGARSEFALPAPLAARLREFAARESVTPFVGVLTAYAALLHRHSGQDDFAIGVPVAGRPDPSTEDMIGCFINLLALRMDLSGSPSFRALLGRVRTTALTGFEHGEVPFELVVNELRPERRIDSSPLFQVAFSFEREPTDALPGLPGLTTSFDEISLDICRYDLSLELTSGRQGIRGWFDYNADIFSPDSIGRLIEHLLALLDAGMAEPDLAVARLPLAPPAERRAVLEDWSGAGCAARGEGSIHGRFSAQAASTPGATALFSADGAVSYGQVERRAGALAGRLRRAGVGPGARVATCSDASAENLAAVLGVLQTGAAYVPIEADEAPLRVARILAAAGADFALAEADRRGPFRACPHLRWIDPGAAGEEGTTTAPAAPAPDSPACILAVSGPVGPRAVVLTHRNIVGSACSEACSGPAGEVTVCSAGFSRSTHTFEIWGRLLNGGAVACASAGAEAEALRWAGRKGGVRTLPLSGDLPAWAGSKDLAEFGRIIAAGGSLPAGRVGELLRAAPGAEMIHAYGATEISGMACWHRVSAVDAGSLTVPIGRPVGDAVVYILDDCMHPSPVGICGELCIGGEAVAQGYAGDSAATAERFVADPYARRPGRRLFRTGDRARFRADGSIEWRGRADRQIRLNGRRAHLGEVEAALTAHRGVVESAALWRGPGVEAPALHAYVAGDAETGPRPEELGDFLRQFLPEYLMPETVTFLPALPRREDGSVDLPALPWPDAASPDAAKGPASRAEQRLAEIWKDIFQTDSVGRHDNFFELGGDSIQVVRLISRASEAGLRITARDVFAHQALEDLAAVAQVAPEAHGESDAVPFPLTPSQRRFFGPPAAGRPEAVDGILLEVPAGLTAANLEAAWKAAASRYDALRLRLRRGPDGWEQSLAPEPGAAFLVADLAALPLPERPAAAAGEIRRLIRSIDPERGPVAGVLLIEGLSENRRLAWLGAHFLVHDAASWKVLVEDFRGVWSGGRAEPPPAPEASFSRWARELAAGRSGAGIQALRERWLELIPEAGPPVGPSVGAEAAPAVLEWSLSQPDTGELGLALKETRTRPAEFIAAALALSLGEWAGTESVQLDLEDAEAAPEGARPARSFGRFAGRHPVRLPARGGDLARFLRGAKERLRAAAALGPSFEFLRYHPSGIDAIAQVPLSPAILRFLGDWTDPILDPADVGLPPWAPPVPPRNFGRGAALIAEARIVRGRLRLRWCYRPDRLAPTEAAALVERFAWHLAALVRHCRAPGVAGLTCSDFPLARLTQPQLERLLGQWHGGDAASGPEDVYALSPLQEGLLFHSRSTPESDSYLVQLTCRVEGPLDLALLERCWAMMGGRHAALRTGFVHEYLPHPVQVVTPAPVPVNWATLDLSSLEAGAREEAFQAHVAQDRARAFDLAHPPLMRMHVARFGPHEARVLWTYHHLVLDGWSMATLQRELFEAYAALAAGVEPALPPTRPYREFIAEVGRQDRSRSLEAWRGYLAGVSAAPALAAWELGPGESAQPSPLDRRFDPAATAELLREIHSHRLTLATVVQGAWALALGAGSDRDDIVFGGTVSGRYLDLAGVESMVGLLVNTVPQRVRIESEAPTLAWLTGLQAAQAAMRPHEHCGLAAIQAVTSFKRGWGQPFFETVVVVENYPRQDPARAGEQKLQISDFHALEREGYPLTLVVLPGPELRLRLFYDQGRFSGRRIGELLDAVEEALRSIARSWNLPVARLLPRPVGPVPAAAPRVPPPPAKADGAAPADPDLEAGLAAIWAELLGREQCGPEEDFYELGGTSLHFMQMSDRIHERLGTDAPVVELLQHATIRSLARYLANRQRPTDAAEEGRRRARHRRARAGSTTARRRTGP